MTQDISHEYMHRCAARTPDGVGFVDFRCDDPGLVGSADILVLRDTGGRLLPARYMGQLSAAARDEPNTLELMGAYRIASSGIAIEEIIGSPWSDLGRDATVHDWGAMGLPDGPRTPVMPVSEPSVDDDAVVAARSAGHRELDASRELSIAPGDLVIIAGRSGTLVAVDRRKRIADIDLGEDDTHVVMLDEIEEQLGPAN